MHLPGCSCLLCGHTRRPSAQTGDGQRILLIASAWRLPTHIKRPSRPSNLNHRSWPTTLPTGPHIYREEYANGYNLPFAHPGLRISCIKGVLCRSTTCALHFSHVADHSLILEILEETPFTRLNSSLSTWVVNGLVAVRSVDSGSQT